MLQCTYEYTSQAGYSPSKLMVQGEIEGPPEHFIGNKQRDFIVLTGNIIDAEYALKSLLSRFVLEVKSNELIAAGTCIGPESRNINGTTNQVKQTKKGDKKEKM